MKGALIEQIRDSIGLMHVGALVRFLKSGSLCRIVKLNDDGTFVVARTDTRKEMLATSTGLEKISECTCCGRPIRRDREVWLEYDAVTDLFHQPGEVPDGHQSNGIFPFGATCARKHSDA